MKRNKTTLTESMALKDFVSDVKTVIRSQKKRKAKYHKVERSPSPEKKLASSGYDAHFEIGSLDDEEENEDDPDWSQKWTRIEEFIEQIGSEDSDEERSVSGSQIV